MVYKIADNITSPLGNTTRQNYQAIKQGHSALRRYDHRWSLPEPFVASLFDEKQIQENEIKGLTRFESIAVMSIKRAVAETDIDIASPRVLFILSTTKGNVELLDHAGGFSEERELPGICAEHIAAYLGITTPPIVTCNACISGVSALILAKRLLETREYDYAIVCGADCQSKFIVSGFQSFKALSAEVCRPFDKNRSGLNLGEAAATLILKGADQVVPTSARWCLTTGAVRNDANHISGPSRTGEGSFRTLRYVMQDSSPDELAFINVHGTATPYNDQMESLAIERAGLSDVPLNALKGFYGHTMGAAGVMETILSICAAEDGTVIGTKGFQETGVTGRVNISSENRPTTKQSFIKLLSGFGGCNAALMLKKTESNICATRSLPTSVVITHRAKITTDEVVVDNKPMNIVAQTNGKTLLSELYHMKIGNYPKFFKMDMLVRLAFVASELLLQAEGKERFVEREDRAVILFNRTSSLHADKVHQVSISDSENFFPSPSVFVYTLPNIATGEIAIRNKYYGETSFYVLPRQDNKQIEKILQASFLDKQTKSIIGGWIDCEDDNHFEADLFIVENQL